MLKMTNNPKQRQTNPASEPENARFRKTDNQGGRYATSDPAEGTESEPEDSIITLIDDEGRMSEFDVLDAIETDDGRFVALLPLASLDDDTGEGEYIILQVVTVDGEEELAEIPDERLVEALADLFRDRFSELYENDG